MRNLDSLTLGVSCLSGRQVVYLSLFPFMLPVQFVPPRR